MALLPYLGLTLPADCVLAYWIRTDATAVWTYRLPASVLDTANLSSAL